MTATSLSKSWGVDMPRLDPITLTVIQSGLQQVCDEMDTTFSRAAFSPIIAEADDRSDGIYSADDGSLIAQGLGGLPVFVGTMQASTRARSLNSSDDRQMRAAPEEGDIYAVNDPYLGGTHLDGCPLRDAVFPQWRALLLVVEYRSLAGYRRCGAGRVFGLGDVCRTGRAAATAGEALQARQDGRRNLQYHHIQHPCCRTAHWRYSRADSGVWKSGANG